MNEFEIINKEALLAVAIDGLPVHFIDGFASIEEKQFNALERLYEQVPDLEHQLIKAIQQRVIDFIVNDALVDLKIIGQAAQAQGQG